MEKTEFATELVRIRKAKGLTQDNVAERCGITVRTIQRIESGDVKPRFYTMKTISEALDFDFLESRESGFDAGIKNQHSKSYFHDFFWTIKDLFNLKINPMKKISILTSTFLIIGITLFAIIPNLSGQKVTYPKSISKQMDKDGAVEKIIVQFSNALTLDSLFYIRNELKHHEITINYNYLRFDENHHLSAINCEVQCHERYGGSFGLQNMDSENKSQTIGFMRDYSENAETPFCTGNCWDGQVSPNEFLLEFQSDGDYITIKNINNCAFVHVGFSLKDGENQAFQQNGMTDLDNWSPLEDNKYADFLFVVERIGNEIKLIGKEGVDWEVLTINCNDNCKQLVSQKGLEDKASNYCYRKILP